MQNLSETVSNDTSEHEGCDLCLESEVFRSAVLPYALMSVPTNLWVLKLMVSSPSFWTERMEVAEFHMVLTELLFGLLGAPMLIVSFGLRGELTSILVKLVCLIFTARVQFQSLVCVERYAAVVRPVLYLKYKLLRFRMSCCCFIWVETFLIGAAQLLLCKVVYIEMNTTYFPFVLIVNLSCSLAILKVLKKPSPGEGRAEGSSSAKRRAFKLVLLVQAIAVIGYGPLIFVLQQPWTVPKEIVCLLHSVTYTFMIWVGGTYPFIYLHRIWKPFVRAERRPNTVDQKSRENY